jgi:hypothetical protein
MPDGRVSLSACAHASDADNNPESIDSIVNGRTRAIMLGVEELDFLSH